MSKYRAKLSPRPSRINTPNTTRSEANPYREWNGGYSPNGRSRSSPESTKAQQTADDHHEGDVQSPSRGHGHNDEESSRKPSAESVSSLKESQFESAINSPATEKSEPEWDFILPEIPLQLTDLVTEDYQPFDLRKLVAYIQTRGNLRSVESYLSRFDKARVKEEINDDIGGFPAMFYVVETNREDIVRTWVKYGGNPTTIHQQSKVPLLAFAIMNSEKIQTDTASMTATLLSLGASPDVIPSAFCLPYLQDLPDTGPSDDSLDELNDEGKNWCKGAAKTKLARTTTLSQRYYLERAAKTKKPSVRQNQVA